MRKFRIVLSSALLLASAGAAFAQSRPSPIDPSLTPRPGASQPMSGLDQEKLNAYRDQLDSRMLDDRMSGRNQTPGGARDMRNLNAELGRVNGALNR